jgi:hypothetical protein
MSFLEKLRLKWGLKSLWQVIIILIIFALTGTTVMLLKKPIVAFFTADDGNVWFSILYYILILPIYNVVLLAYGFLFGQFSFFWEFEKRTWNRIFGKKD